MKNSQKLNIILAIITFLVINWVFRSLNTLCFNWFDYSTNFGTLFVSMGINLIAVFEE